MRAEDILPACVAVRSEAPAGYGKCLILPGLAIAVYVAMWGIGLLIGNLAEGFYNEFVLWFTGNMHPYTLAAAALATIVLSRAALRGNRTRGWAILGAVVMLVLAGLAATAFFQPALQVLLLVPLCFWAAALTFRESGRRAPIWRAMVGGVLLTLAGVGLLYLAWPWNYLRFSLPILPVALIWVFLYVGVRAHWLQLGLYRAGHHRLRRYLERSPRGESYFRLLGSLRDDRGGAVYDGDGMRIERIVATEPAQGAPLADRAVRFAAKRPWVAPLLRPLTPSLPASLLDHDPMLCGELQALRLESLHRAEQALYGDGSELPPLNDAEPEAQRWFGRWLAYTDALVECCIFNMKIPQRTAPGGEGTIEPRHEFALKYAAELCADAARRLLLPTLREDVAGTQPAGGRGASGPRPVLWIDRESTGSSVQHRACEFLLREILCLEILCGEASRDPHERRLAELADILRSSPALPRERLVRLRLVLACLDFQAVTSKAHPNGAAGRGPGDADWTNLRTSLEACLERVANGADLPALWFELGTRVRFLDLCWHSDPVQETLAEKHAEFMDKTYWKKHAGSGPWQTFDHELLAVMRLAQARDRRRALADGSEPQLLTALQRAVGVVHCSFRALPEYLSPERSHSVKSRILEAMQHVKPSAPDRAHPKTDPDAGRRAIDCSAWTCPRPNVFTRIPAHAAALAATVAVWLGLGVAWWLGPTHMKVPDFRLAQAALQGPVNTLSPGDADADEPSLWVGTRGDGLHVHARGRTPHWYHVAAGPDTDQLLSDDVRRIAVGERWVACLCAQEGARGLCVSRRPWFDPGQWCELGLGDWLRIIDFSTFADISDPQVTALLQTGDDNHPLLLVGTQGAGLGRYDVRDRRWLAAQARDSDGNLVPCQIDEDHQFLPAGHGRISDIATLKIGSQWHAWLATDRGLAGGPVLAGEASPDSPVDKDQWRIQPAETLVDPKVVQLAARPTKDQPPMVAYLGAGNGMGEVNLGEGDPTCRVRIGQNRVPALTRESLRQIAYDAAGKRIWLARQAPGTSGPRICAYREATHEWNIAEADLSAADKLHELITVPGLSGHALAASESGLQRWTDSAPGPLTAENLGPPGEAVQRVVAGTGSEVAVLSRDSVGRYAIKHGNAGTKTCQWTDIIGPRRFPNLTLEAVSTAVPWGETLLLGTRNEGIACVDPRTREVYPLLPSTVSPPGQAESIKRVADLAVAEPSGWLYQVSDDHVVSAIRLPEGDAWTPVANHTAGSVSPDETVAMKVHQEQLYLGSPHAISAYDMRTRLWRDYPPVEQLSELLSAGRTLWAHGVVGSEASLFALVSDTASQPEWESRFPGFKAADVFDDHLAVLDRVRAVKLVDPAGETADLVSPTWSAAGTDPPRLAAADGQVLYLLPVSGGVARYNLARHQWTTTPLPGQCSQPIGRMEVNRAGVWLVDADDSLFLQPVGANGVVAQVDGPPVARQVAQAFFGSDEAIVVLRDGRVVQIAVDSQRVLVGDALATDEQPLTALEFAGDLFVAAGAKVGRYRFADHAWQTAAPAGEVPVARLVATGSYLYALDAHGGLHRSASGGSEDWMAVGDLLRNLEPPEGVRTLEAAQGLVVASIASLGDALGAVVPGRGSFVVSDSAPDDPRWIQAQSLGPPEEAEITCALELADELVLGTREHGLWSYFSRRVGKQTLPPMWESLTLPDAKAGAPPAVRRIVAIPGNATNLGVLTDSEAIWLRRASGEGWQATGTLRKGSVDELAADANGFLVSETRADGSTGLWHTDLQGNTRCLIGAAVGDRSPTAAVAVEPSSGGLFRASAAGRLSVYSWPARAWSEASLARAAAVQELPVAADSLWAWAPAEGQLYRRKDNAWTLQADSLTGLAWDNQGLLLGRGDRGIELLEEGGSQTILPPEARGVFPASWDKVDRLAELGDWLVVSVPGTGLFGYQRRSHFWTRIAASHVIRFEEAGADGAQPPSAYYVLDAGGAVRRLTLVGDQPRLSEVTLPVEEPVRQLLRAGPHLLALTASGKVCTVGEAGAAGEVWISPSPLAESSQPRLLAAAEYYGLLMLSYAAGQQGGGRLAVYYPNLMRWYTLEIPEGAIARFHSLGKSGPLFGEIVLAEADADGPARGMVEILPPGGTRRQWERRLVLAKAYDFAGSADCLAAVDADRRIVVYSAEQKSFVDAGFAAHDRLPGEIQSAFVAGDSLIVLLPDKTLWRYSLDALRWERQEPGRSFLKLIAAEGELYAVEEASWTFFRYSDEAATSGWAAVEPSREENAQGVVVLQGRRTPRNDRWETRLTDGQRTFRWRSSAAVDGETAGAGGPWDVGFSQSRFDFDRYSRIELRDGALWAETLASRDGHPVYRTFTLAGGKPTAEAVRGDARFAIAADEGNRHLAEASPLEFQGSVFALARVADAASGGWTGAPPGENAVACRLTLQRTAGEPVPVRLVKAGEGELALDVDVWNVLAAAGSRWIAASAGGLWTCAPPAPPAQRQGPPSPQFVAFAPVPAGIDALAPTEKGLVARTAEQPPRFLASTGDGKWVSADDGPARQALADQRSPLESNGRLRSWRVARAGEGTTLSVLVEASETFVPVTLASGGFGFDRALGMELIANEVLLYTRDGRVSLARRGGDRPPRQLEPAYALPIDEPGRVVHDPTSGRLVLLTGERSETPGALAYVEGGPWQSLTDAEYDRLNRALRATLASGGDWEWKSDETVRVSLPPFAESPLSGRFDPASGSFSFDRVRALHAHAGEVWVATDACILHYRDGRFVAHSLPGLESLGPSLQATFHESGNGRSYLLAGPAAQPAQACFEFDQAWTVPADEPAARQAAGEAAAWGLHGQVWRAKAAQWNVTAEQPRRRFSTAAHEGAAEFVEVELSAAGLWSFESGCVLGGTAAAPVWGSAGGLCLLTDVGAPRHGRRTLANAGGTVVRIERDGAALHAGLADGEEWLYDAATLARGDRPERSFAERDREVLQSDRWQWQRDEQGRMTVAARLNDVDGLIPTSFAQGRFDFDRVGAAGRDSAGILLGTEAGCFHRVAQDGSLVRIASLPALKPADVNDMFTLWWKGGLHTLIAAGENQVFDGAGGTWTPLDAAQTAALLGERVSLAARSSSWTVRRDAGELDIHLRVGDGADQPVRFYPNTGGFGFDYYRDVRFAAVEEEAPRLMVATEGGVCHFALDATFLALDADLDSDGSPDAIAGVWRTEVGPLARLHGEPPRYYALFTEGWTPVDAAQAEAWIRATKVTVDTDEQGWTVRRNPDIPRGAEAFTLRWQGEPVLPAEGPEARFLHDQARSALVWNGSLWIASDGGVQRFQIDAASGTLKPAVGRNLWTSPLQPASPAPRRPFSVRLAESGGSPQLFCRATEGMRQLCLVFDPRQDSWNMVNADEMSFDPTLLHHREGWWTWRQPAGGTVHVALDPNTFELAQTATSRGLFSNGTLAFWDIDPAARHGGDPVALRDGWFIATSAGVLRVPASDTRRPKLYGRSQSGEAIVNVTHVTLTDQGEVLALAADSPDPVYRLKDDAWTAHQQDFPFRERQPVHSGWMVWSRPVPGRVEVALAANAAAAEPLPGDALFAEDRFAFDVVRQFAVAEGYVLVTPAGIFELAFADGSVRHLGRPSGGTGGTAARVDFLQGQLYATLDDGQVLRRDGKRWVDCSEEAGLADELRAVARNALFCCRRRPPGGYEMQFTIGDLPPFPLGDPAAPMLSGGVFAFDDLRDARFEGDLMLASTRLGIWTYGLRDDADTRLPLSICYFDADGGAMNDLGAFRRLAETPEVATVCRRDGSAEFTRSDDGKWHLAAHRARPTEYRDIVWSDGQGIRASVSADRKQLVLSAVPGSTRNLVSANPGAMGFPWSDDLNLVDIFTTSSAAWVPLDNEIHWIRCRF